MNHEWVMQSGWISQLPALVVIIPFFMAFIVALVGWSHEDRAIFLTEIGLLLSFLASIGCLFVVVEHGPVSYRMAGWAPPMGIEYRVDFLNALVLVVITSCSLISVFFSKAIVQRDFRTRKEHFYTLYLLLVTGLLGITITHDAFNLYVLVEISALTSYALIAMGRGRAAFSAFQYVMIGTIGACFYLIGVGYLYVKTGTLNMSDLQLLIADLHDSRAIKSAFVFIMLGTWIKMGLFPLHGWLPNAYSDAKDSASCLIAPLMTKVSVYIMLRLMLTVFTPSYVFSNAIAGELVLALAVVAIVVGSLKALKQTSLKRMLTYIIVAEVGYMVGGAWTATASGLTGVMYHIISDAAMTLCMFMAVAVISFKRGRDTFDVLPGLYKRMPLTMAAFTVGAFSLIGIPPTCGFFSKWYLLSGAIDAHAWHYMAALIFSSLVNAVLFFRIIEKAFIEPVHAAGAEATVIEMDEAPLRMTLPLVFVAISLIAIGVCTNYIVRAVIQYAIPEGVG